MSTTTVIREQKNNKPYRVFLIRLFTIGSLLWVVSKGLNFLSYSFCKRRTFFKRRWDLNICCGKTDGGGVNADIVKHGDVPNFVLVEDIYRLPFQTQQFRNTVCSHTMEHIEDPDKFYRELRRVSKDVTLILPPLWDYSAVLNFYEHRWIFLTFKKVHNSIPLKVKLPFARNFQNHNGQRIRC